MADDSSVVRADPEVRGGVRALPTRVRRPLGVAAVLAATVLVIMSFVFAGMSVAGEFGIPAEHRPLARAWVWFVLFVDWTGEPVGALVVLVTLVVVFLWMRNVRAAALAVAGTGATIVVTTAMKPLVGRTINDGFLSFPSGHTATATAFALVATLVVVGRNPRHAWLLAAVPLFAAATMAWVQVLLNAHYPTDTVGGFCAAIAVVPVVAWVVDRFADRPKSTKD